MTAEQQARDLLERIIGADAQGFTAGDVVEVAHLIAEHSAQKAEITRLRALLHRCQMHLACNAVTDDLIDLYERIRAELERP